MRIDFVELFDTAEQKYQPRQSSTIRASIGGNQDEVEDVVVVVDNGVGLAPNPYESRSFTGDPRLETGGVSGSWKPEKFPNEGEEIMVGLLILG